MAKQNPLSDDWLYWNPETIHAYPEVEENSPTGLEPGSESPQTREVTPPQALTLAGSAGWLTMEFLRYVAAALLVGFVAGMLLTFLVVFFPAIAQAAESSESDTVADARVAALEAVPEVRLSKVARGSLLFTTNHAELYRYAPMLRTEVLIEITGPVGRVQVSQRFRNPGAEWVEGLYVFPLPEKAAVDHMWMQVGERIIEGRFKERGEAKKTYVHAKQAGRKAALIEQERPNLFTNSVANIGPGEEVMVEIEYQQTLRYQMGHFSIRFPMVVGPRYIPGAPIRVEETVPEFDGRGWAVSTDRVSDAPRITPPVMDPRNGPTNPVRITVDLRPGFPLSSLESPYHDIRVEHPSEGRTEVTLDSGSVPADRDFVLLWAPKTGHAPKAAWFTESREDYTYALLMVMPPDTMQARRLPREVIYVIDTSGSMAGASIRQAKQVLAMVVDRLRPGDRFNLIQFNSRAERLFRTARGLNSETRKRARRFVQSLEARGGTNMAPALTMALRASPEETRVRQIIFLTDGAVGNESEVFHLIRKRLGDSRLFTIGIGSAPNSHFMTKAAQFGRGTFTYVGKVGEVGAQMKRLFAKLETPVMSDLRVRWPQTDRLVEAWPNPLPDLYSGEPLVVSARMHRTAGDVVVTGRLGDRQWHSTVKLRGGREETGIAKVWARKKIAALMDSMHEGADKREVRESVINLGLRHHLVTRYTSLVAVDVTPSRPAEAPLASGAVPTNLPHGWQYDGVFGQLPQTATAASVHVMAGLLALGLGLFFLLGQRRTA